MGMDERDLHLTRAFSSMHQIEVLVDAMLPGCSGPIRQILQKIRSHNDNAQESVMTYRCLTIDRIKREVDAIRNACLDKESQG